MKEEIIRLDLESKIRLRLVEIATETQAFSISHPEEFLRELDVIANWILTGTLPEGRCPEQLEGISGKELDRILLPKGQIIKIRGIPFKLESDTVVLGRRENIALIKDAAVCGPAKTDDS